MVTNPQKLMKLGLKTELENDIRRLSAAIVAGSTCVSTALFTTGDVAMIDIQTARIEFDRLEANINELKKARESLERLENS